MVAAIRLILAPRECFFATPMLSPRFGLIPAGSKNESKPAKFLQFATFPRNTIRQPMSRTRPVLRAKPVTEEILADDVASWKER
jgi:hypothetical protein